MSKATAALRRYEVWVKDQNSLLSGQPAGDHHHIKVKGVFGGTTKQNLSMIPLTREEHTEFHAVGQDSWEWKHKVSQLDGALKTISKALDEGVLTFDHVDPDGSLQAIEVLFRSGLIEFNVSRPGDVLLALEQLYLADVVKAV